MQTLVFGGDREQLRPEPSRDSICLLSGVTYALDVLDLVPVVQPGDLTGVLTLTNTGTVEQSGVVTLAGGSVTNELGATWTLANGILLATGDTGTFNNAGTLTRGNVAVANNITADFVNVETGVVKIASGTLFLDGQANSLAGTVTGAGTLGFGGGLTTLGRGLTLATAAVAIKGAATQVVLDESLAWSGRWSQYGGTVDVASGCCPSPDLERQSRQFLRYADRRRNRGLRLRLGQRSRPRPRAAAAAEIGVAKRHPHRRP